MKKILIMLGSIIVLTIFMILGKSLLFNAKEDVKETYQVKNENVLSMMLEQNIGEGDYEMTTRSSWPTIEDGYIFNSTLSKCENGSKLSWNEELNAVVMSGSVSDKCYMYFDVYNPPVIVDVILSELDQWTPLMEIYTESKYNIVNYNISFEDSNLKKVNVSSPYSKIRFTPLQEKYDSLIVDYKNQLVYPFLGNFEIGDYYNVEIYVRDEYDQISDTYGFNEYISFCFVAGTKVQTLNGLVNIEDIKIGDYVYTLNETTNEKELKKVIKTITSETSITYDISVDGIVVTSSPRHPFYVVDKGYVRAYNLKEGDILLSANGTYKIEKKKTNYYNNPIKTYNLTVEDNHNFLITENELLVHNTYSTPDVNVTIPQPYE